MGARTSLDTGRPHTRSRTFYTTQGQLFWDLESVLQSKAVCDLWQEVGVGAGVPRPCGLPAAGSRSELTNDRVRPGGFLPGGLQGDPCPQRRRAAVGPRAQLPAFILDSVTHWLPGPLLHPRSAVLISWSAVGGVKGHAGAARQSAQGRHPGAAARASCRCGHAGGQGNEAGAQGAQTQPSHQGRPYVFCRESLWPRIYRHSLTGNPQGESTQAS